MALQSGNNVLANCGSIEQVVELINDEMATDAKDFALAAEYAINAAEEAGCGMTRADLQAHLDFLSEAGADFDYHEALELALKQKK